MHPTRKSASCSMTGIQKAISMKKMEKMSEEINEAMRIAQMINMTKK